MQGIQKIPLHAECFYIIFEKSKLLFSIV